jgi:hypothetical protein
MTSMLEVEYSQEKGTCLNPSPGMIFIEKPFRGRSYYDPRSAPNAGKSLGVKIVYLPNRRPSITQMSLQLVESMLKLLLWALNIPLR